MNTKRWLALGAAALLFFISIGLNAILSVFSTDFMSSWEDAFARNSTYSEQTIQDGSGNSRIAVLSVDGVIQDTGGATSLLGSSGFNYPFFMEQLNMILEDSSVKGVVLKVNSPGGGVVESAEIYNKIVQIQEERKIPIYVSMGAIAASGGYYISAPADKIFLNRETMTGSIGVIMSSMNYGKLAEKYGVDFVTIKSGEYKDIMSPTREMTAAERSMLQDMINESYEHFVDIIEAGRGMSEQDVKKVADGRIVNGRQAIEAGLADGFGYTEDVIAAMKADFGLEKAQVFQYSMNDSWSSLFSMKANTLFGGSMETQLVGKLLADYQAPRLMYLYGEQ